MAFGVFIHRPDSIYNDRLTEQYQFPSIYLERVRSCVDDWIIYYEPKKVTETRGYFAAAKVEKIVPDRSAPNLYLALIGPGTYVDFVRPVPFSGPDGVVEQGVLNEQGAISGRAQSAVRSISPIDFHRILKLASVSDETVDLPRTTSKPANPEFSEMQKPFQFEQTRDRINCLSSRVVRDRVFRTIVVRAYDSRCAVTGLRLINGGGRAEVEAAHIRPVEASGPDAITNGLALSGTAHWMFDRGLIAVADDRQILISRSVNDINAVRALINPAGRILPPDRPIEHPHPRFLQWHRENCFKG